MSTFAEVFAEFLDQTQTKYIFGFPGGATVELAEKCRLRGIEFVLAHSEASAGYMANMYGDLTGTPGVAMATLGPGASNLVNPTALALLDRTPFVAITGSQGLGAGNYPHQKFNQVSLFEPVTKWSTQASAASLGKQLSKAWRLATNERPGPVHLDVPADEPTRETPDLDAAPDPQKVGGLSWDVEAACRALSSARHPMILAGNGAGRHRVGAALNALVESCGIPFVTTSKAKGVISERSPWWGGVLDMASPRHIEAFVSRADLLLLVGFDPVELIRHWHPTCPVITIDASPDVDVVFAPSIEMVGDMTGILNAMVTTLKASSAWTPEDVDAQRTSYRETATMVCHDALAPSLAIEALRAALPSNTIVVSDVGSHKMALGSLWECSEPRTFFQSNGLGTMGYSMGAGIAAKLLQPDVPVAVLTGDGGFAMVTSELGTASDLGLSLIVVVFSDGALDRIVRKQVAQNYPAIGTQFGKPNYRHIAAAFGAAGYEAGTQSAIREAIQEALTNRGPSLIEVVVSTKEYERQFET